MEPLIGFIQFAASDAVSAASDLKTAWLAMTLAQQAAVAGVFGLCLLYALAMRMYAGRVRSIHQTPPQRRHRPHPGSTKRA